MIRGIVSEMTRAIAVFLLAFFCAGCGATARQAYVDPGMSRQEVIKRLGPPMAVVSKEELGVEYLHYRLPPLEPPGGGARLVEVVVPIHEGVVVSPDHFLGID